MAIALVQSATQVDIGASGTTAPSITINGTVAGNALVAYAAIFDANNTFTLTSTTDGGNSFTTRQGEADFNATNGQIGAVAAALAIAGGNRTVAFNLSGTSVNNDRYYTLGCQEWSGVMNASAEDTFDVNTLIDIDTNDVNAGPITTTDKNALLVGLASVLSSDTTLNFASPTSWTNSYRQNNPIGAAGAGLDAGYWLPGAIQTTYTAQWTHDNVAAGSFKGAGIVVALKMRRFRRIVGDGTKSGSLAG